MVNICELFYRIDVNFFFATGLVDAESEVKDDAESKDNDDGKHSAVCLNFVAFWA